MSRASLGLSALGFLASSLVSAQPTLYPAAPAVNSASYRISGSTGSGVAQGSIFTVFGNNLGPSTAVRASAFPLPTELGKTSINVTVNGVSKPAIILYTSPTQVNAILPSSTPAGTGTFSLTYDGKTSSEAPITVVDRSFGIYTFGSTGSGQAIVTDGEGVPYTIIRTLHPGDWAILWGTGLGPIGGDDAAPPPTGSLAGETEVYVGDVEANVSYKGRSGCCSGLDQINFQVPDNIQGCHVPVAVRTGGAVSNMAMISVSRSGSTCTDSLMGQDLVDQLAAGRNVSFGFVRLENINSPFYQGLAVRANSDYAIATFSRYTPDSAGFAQYGVSSGYCIAVDCSNGCGVKTFSGTAIDSSPAQLDAGATLNVAGQGTRSMSRVTDGFYGSLLNQTSARFLWSKLPYTVSGTAGQNVGAFSVTSTSGVADVEITNLTRGQTVPRTGSLTVEWKGGDPEEQNGQVTIGGYSIRDLNSSNIALFQCTAPLSAKRLTIPDWIIASLPPSGSGQSGTITYPLGWIWIGQYVNPTTFTADGLDRGIMTNAFFSGIGIWFE